MAEEYTYTTNFDYSKKDYVAEKELDPEQLKRIHTAICEKQPSFKLPAIGVKLNTPKMTPARRDPMCGLQLDIEADGRIIVTGMKLMSSFQDSRLKVGDTLLAINGVTDYKTVAEAEKIITEAENKGRYRFATPKAEH